MSELSDNCFIETPAQEFLRVVRTAQREVKGIVRLVSLVYHSKTFCEEITPVARIYQISYTVPINGANQKLSHCWVVAQRLVRVSKDVTKRCPVNMVTPLSIYEDMSIPTLNYYEAPDLVYLRHLYNLPKLRKGK